MTNRVSTLLRRSGLLALLFLLTGFLPALADTYRLAPGDVIRAQIIGVTESAYSARVDTAGNIRLPLLGTHRAAGKTLDELIDDISIETAGRQIGLGESGIGRVIVLDKSDIFMDIERYRPVTVTGAVASSGRVEFEPGMTVRAAIAVAGGFSLPGLTRNGTQLSNLRIRNDELRKTEAWLAADLWRIDALLSGTDAKGPPSDATAMLEAELSESDLETMRLRIAGELDQQRREHEDLDARIELAKAQIEFLKIAVAQYEAASNNEEARLLDIQSLSERGLSTANALDNARSDALNVSARLLTTQADLAEAERNLQALQRDNLEIDEKYQQARLVEKARIEKSLAEIRAQARAVRSEMVFGAAAQQEEEQVPGRAIMLYRGRDGGEEVSLGAPVEPGDVIEVLLDDG